MCSNHLAPSAASTSRSLWCTDSAGAKCFYLKTKNVLKYYTFQHFVASRLDINLAAIGFEKPQYHIELHRLQHGSYQTFVPTNKGGFVPEHGMTKLPEHNSLKAGGKHYIISEIMSVLTFARKDWSLMISRSLRLSRQTGGYYLPLTMAKYNAREWRCICY